MIFGRLSVAFQFLMEHFFSRHSILVDFFSGFVCLFSLPNNPKLNRQQAQMCLVTAGESYNVHQLLVYVYACSL